MRDYVITSFHTTLWVLLSFWAYWFIISLFGFGKARKLRERIPQKRFLILIPAHNEERVIGNLVKNLFELDYPNQLYIVCVIADNCTDNTAEISRSLGAHVIEHTSAPGEPRGKPHGIRYALEQLGDDLEERFDGVTIIDADNLVSLNYLREMNKHMLRGDRLIQCYLDSKNPNDNWVTLSYAVAYYYMNRSWQLAKSRLGLGNAIGGTGFCVETKLLREVGWTAASLTEDLEFTMQCLLRGVPATWAHHAKIYDEKPESFSASCVQRVRWARGHWDVCFKYSLPLLWRAVSRFDIRAFDGFMYLINPGKIVLTTATSVVLWVQIIMFPWTFHTFVSFALWAALILFNLSYINYVLNKDGKASKFGKALWSLTVMNYSYVPLFVWAFFTTGNRTWRRTDHSRAMSLNEIDLAAAQVAAGREV